MLEAPPDLKAALPLEKKSTRKGLKKKSRKEPRFVTTNGTSYNISELGPQAVVETYLPMRTSKAVRGKLRNARSRPSTDRKERKREGKRTKEKEVMKSSWLKLVSAVG